jgi:signal transduction histidine kinase
LPNILSSAIGKQVRQIHLWLIVNSFIYTALVAVVSVYISHKIAGPVFKLKKQIREIIDSGDTNKKIFLRKGDELNDLAAVINELLEKVSIKNK